MKLLTQSQFSNKGQMIITAIFCRQILRPVESSGEAENQEFIREENLSVELRHRVHSFI